MTNDELAGAIQFATDRLSQTTGPHADMWAKHLADLLAIQVMRARAPEPINMMPGPVIRGADCLADKPPTVRGQPWQG